MELLDVMKNLTIKNVANESNQNFFKSIAADIDDVPTEIVYADYSDKIMLIISQYQKIGSLLMIQKEQEKNSKLQQDIWLKQLTYVNHFAYSLILNHMTLRQSKLVKISFLT
ncbi:unnamed protein product [Pieris macdunnoughi]|uniref:Uncharacterized protein n=1 Tax=Pieris macdunnoughi TaxID=345717 RepID=A0A821N5B5_9NEOP|nr:unnamed protein product [Pieris macdunnoughi]